MHVPRWPMNVTLVLLLGCVRKKVKLRFSHEPSAMKTPKDAESGVQKVRNTIGYLKNQLTEPNLYRKIAELFSLKILSNKKNERPHSGISPLCQALCAIVKSKNEYDNAHNVL